MITLRTLPKNSTHTISYQAYTADKKDFCGNFTMCTDKDYDNHQQWFEDDLENLIEALQSIRPKAKIEAFYFFIGDLDSIKKGMDRNPDVSHLTDPQEKQMALINECLLTDGYAFGHWNINPKKMSKHSRKALVRTELGIFNKIGIKRNLTKANADIHIFYKR